MKTKFLSILIFTLIVIIDWMHWSNSSTQNNKALSFQQVFKDYFLIKQVAIEPNVKLCYTNPFIIIIVTSYVGHVELRSAHRRAMPQHYLKKHNILRIFLLAQIPLNERFIIQGAIQNESDIYEDILQGTFIENYRNLTYKHLMGLHWVSKYCNTSSYVLKVDDDTVFNVEQTIALLQNLKRKHSQDFLMGYMLNNTKPRRNRQNKWYVTQNEYEHSSYPTYVSGWFYLTTPQLANKITEIARYHKYFWIDDIFVTGILTEALGIKLNHVPQGFWLEYYELLECCLRDMIIKNIECTYTVGPNGGRNNLILEFTAALNHCKKSSICRKRTATNVLEKNCIAYKDRAIFSDGKAKVELLKL